MTKKIKKTKENISNLPSKDENYNLLNRKGDIVYTGQGNIKDRITAHSNEPNVPFTSFTYNPDPSAKKRKEIEEKRIKRYKPPLKKLYDRDIIKISGEYDSHQKVIANLTMLEKIKDTELSKLKDIKFKFPIKFDLEYKYSYIFGFNEEYHLYAMGSTYDEMLQDLYNGIKRTIELYLNSTIKFTETSKEYRKKFLETFS